MFNLISRITFLIALVVLAKSESQSAKYTYWGCYQDRTDITLFDPINSAVGNVSLASPDRCMDECLKTGKAYAGISGEKCFCSDDYPSQIVKTSDLECSPQWIRENPDFLKTKVPRLAVYETGYVQSNTNTYPAKIYMGCYREENTEFRLLKGSWQQLATNSPTVCHRLCVDTGFRYFGLTYREECFCGETAPTENVIIDNSECNLPCAGDKTAKCGGGWITSVYATGITDFPSHGRYVGCYKNPEDDELYIAELKITLKISNSPRRCLNICDQKGYEYAAVQNRDQCLCAKQAPPNSTLEANRNCHIAKCPGDPTDFCGSKNSLRLFKTRKNEKPNGRTDNLGCFSAQQENQMLTAARIVLPYSLTPNMCIDICKNRGYPVAGVIFGKYCHCDFYFPSALSYADENECRSLCSGNPNQFCGGPLRFNAYFTGLRRTGALPASIYKGCFRDDNKQNRLLLGSWQELENDSPRVCQQLCYRTGYLFFGLTWIKECFCGDQNPNVDYAVDEGECNKPCGGDASKICGGGWRTNIYSTGLSILPVGDKYLGCFDDPEGKSAVSDLILILSSTNSPERCLSICDQNGYKYAGVKRSDCHCGNKFNLETTIKADDSECNLPCPGDSTEHCGKSNKIQLYATTITNPIIDEEGGDDIDVREGQKCGNTYSSKNKQKVCKGEILFQDDFASLKPALWKPQRKLASRPDYEFVTYTCAPDNVGVKDGYLYVKPVLQADSVVTGKINIVNCTGKLAEECSKQAQNAYIIPPVNSARITTEDSFTFRYGTIDVRAQFPVGDWIVGEIWLVPKDYSYGEYYQSGVIRIATVRGNKQLTCDGKQFGYENVEVGVYVGLLNNVKQKTLWKFSKDGWTSGYHNYSLTWTPDNLSFSIDGENLPPLLKPDDESLHKATGQPPNAAYIWRDGSRLAPLDREFYISVGISVGGMLNFPDSCVAGTTAKPWVNGNPKAMATFWRSRNQWISTWPKDQNVLKIDHIKVTAL